MVWFVFGLVVEIWRFELMGVFVFLVFYNGLIFFVIFFCVLYCKFFGCLVIELYYIVDGWLELVSGLIMLFEWDESNGLVEDVFFCIYDFFVFVFGRYIFRDMKKYGGVWFLLVSVVFL